MEGEKRGLGGGGGGVGDVAGLGEEVRKLR